MKITEIKGTITTTDDVVREFSISVDGGWQQWGATTKHLGDTVEALEVIARALMEDDRLASDDDEDEADDDS